MITWPSYLIELHRDKDLAYGDAWCRRGEAAGIFPNIARKYDRWIRIHDEQTATMTGVEPLDDTLADLLIYAVKYLLWLLERHPEAAAVLPADLTASPNVADALTLVTQMSPVEEPAELITSAFERLERVFVEGEDDSADDRVYAAWSLAVGAWSELGSLPLPQASSGAHPLGASSGADPFGASSPSTQDLQDQLLAALAEAPGSVLLLGLTANALELRARVETLGLGDYISGIAHPGQGPDETRGVLDWSQLAHRTFDYLVVASDEEKEDLLWSYIKDVKPTATLPKVILTGVGHLAFRDPLFTELDAPALVRSYATGYPYTRVHIFQHLCAAAANGLSGAVVEFGAFKGGTTAWLARVARHLNLDVPVLAFDSWDGFPSRRSVLDMYTHPRCVFSDIEAVRAYLEPLGVELVPGDISDTAPLRLKDLPILLAFIDTDNYSPATAALMALADNVVPGGAIVFDHYTTTSDYIYTLGERMAAQACLPGRGFLQIHSTGVFLRLPDMK